MNRTEESRNRRREKSKRANMIAVGVIVGVIVFGLLIASALGVIGNSPDKKKGKETNQTQTEPVTEQVDPNATTDSNSEQTENPNSEKVYSKEEKDRLEAENREKYGDFYVPLPDVLKPARDVIVKGLYITHSTAAFDFNEENIQIYEEYIKYLNGERESEPEGVDGVNKLERALAICNQTPINALVIDVKSDDGYVTWSSDIKVVNDLDTSYPSSYDDFEGLLKYMKAHDIYPIARVVVFKDFVLPEIRPEHAMQLIEGGSYKDDQGMPWVNQYDHFVWDYVVAISKEAALRGFEEIHFDYIRYPDNAAGYNPIVTYPGREEGKRKDQNIQDFIEYAMKELKPYNVKVAAAVFGIITRSWEDYPEDIGQTWIKITRDIDVISPMIYPSHYSEGWYGYDVPDREPYGLFHKALLEALEKNASMASPAKIRPWIQGFTAEWVDGYLDYTPEVIAQQVIAGEELGIDEFLIWNAVSEYNPTITNYLGKTPKNPVVDPNNLPDFSMSETPAEDGQEPAKVLDILGRTPLDAARKFLAAIQQQYTDEIFLLTKISEREAKYEDFAAAYSQTNLGLEDYNFDSVTKTDSGYEFTFNARFTSNAGVAEIIGGKLLVVIENQVFKCVLPPMTFTPAPVEATTEAPGTEESTEPSTEETTEPETEETSE